MPRLVLYPAIKEATLSRLMVRCERCGTSFALRDSGFEDPAVGTWCPRCGNRSVEKRDGLVRVERPEAAA
jgi:ribosomal protein S27AE